MSVLVPAVRDLGLDPQMKTCLSELLVVSLVFYLQKVRCSWIQVTGLIQTLELVSVKVREQFVQAESQNGNVDLRVHK